LVVAYNPLFVLPNGLGTIPTLQELFLRNCNLRSLPLNIVWLQNLCVLDLSGNPLTELQSLPEVNSGELERLDKSSVQQFFVALRKIPIPSRDYFSCPLIVLGGEANEKSCFSTILLAQDENPLSKLYKFFSSGSDSKRKVTEPIVSIQKEIMKIQRYGKCSFEIWDCSGSGMYFILFCFLKKKIRFLFSNLNFLFFQIRYGSRSCTTSYFFGSYCCYCF
jgi:hypothetical protein